MRHMILHAMLAIILTLTGIAPSHAATAEADAALARAFEYAQLASLTESTLTLSAAAVLASRSGTKVAALEAERQATETALRQAEQGYDLALLAKDDAAKAQLTAFREERTRLLVQLRKLDAAIAAADPALQDLLRPEAVSLADAQALLTDDEALLFLFTFDQATYSFAVTREAARWHRSTVYSATRLTSEVAGLHAMMRAGMLGEVPPESGFDTEKANALFADLIAPHDALLAKHRRLLTIVSGPLAGLPLALLPSRKGQLDQRLDWLGERHLLSSLASVGMLRAQRCLLVPPAARHPGCRVAGVARPATGQRTAFDFLGIGDPRLGVPTSRLGIAARGAGDWITRGIAVRDRLMAMNSLPGTGRELRSAAQLFPAGRSRLLMGDAAIEPAVRDALQRQPARFISFATHGLLASETGGLAEPGLVLTPPTQAELAPGNDGYLSVSEIAQLQFSGAAVILSACNTATIEPRSASRSLNSLARAFQFAGANRIIASYWSVDDEATAAFMARFFSIVVANPALRLDEALQKAQADLRSDPRWRSPAYWAAFGLIGTP